MMLRRGSCARVSHACPAPHAHTRLQVVYVLIGWLQIQTSIQAFLCLALSWIFFKNVRNQKATSWACVFVAGRVEFAMGL